MTGGIGDIAARAASAMTAIQPAAIHVLAGLAVAVVASMAMRWRST